MNWISISIRDTHIVFVVVGSICIESSTRCISPANTVSSRTSGNNSRVYTGSCTIKSSTRISKSLYICWCYRNNRSNSTISIITKVDTKISPPIKTCILTSSCCSPRGKITCCFQCSCACIHCISSAYILIFPNISTRTSILCPKRKCWFCILWSSSCGSWTRSRIGISWTLSESISITNCRIGST
jgi:hypothetical protein